MTRIALVDYTLLDQSWLEFNPWEHSEDGKYGPMNSNLSGSKEETEEMSGERITLGQEQEQRTELP